jgi:glycosyltransferase involved in cell wall biosynthesis
MKSDSPRYSVVVPVFNEADNIGLFCRKALAELPSGYELLVCYDFDGDSTLPALAAIPPAEKPPAVRLVKNDLGRGVRYAIEAGMRAAQAPVVVVMMADLSDDFAKVEPMVAKAEAGADVVCASRYMRGGKQIGGPRMKGFLSRMAGLSLHWLAGLPTHDPTNSFKAYRKEFLDRTPIESAAGFCLGLELTAKAHFRGGRVAEVPAVWLDRTAGESRFQLRKWLPLYLRWYFWAFDQRYRRPLAAAVSALLGLFVFLTVYMPVCGADPVGVDAGWSHGLSYAYTHHWRAGVDYIFTYGPLGFLTTLSYDPAVHTMRLAWEVAIAVLVSIVAVRAVRAVRPWPARVAFVFALTVLCPFVRNGMMQDAKYYFLTTGLTVGLLSAARPSRWHAAAVLSLFGVLALTKFTFLILTAGLGAIILIHIAMSRGWRSAAMVAAVALSAFALAWTVWAGQAIGDLPTFLRNGLTLAGGYGAAMHLPGPRSELIAALMGVAALILAALMRTPASSGRLARLLPTVAVAWIAFLLFKASFVRHEPLRLTSFFWTVTSVALIVWPRVDRARLALAPAALAAAIGLYGIIPASAERWSAPADWVRHVGGTARYLSHRPQRDAWLARMSDDARNRAALPAVVAAVGDRSIDMVTQEPGLLLANGLNWTPRPVFQSYSAHAPELQRLNRDLFRSASAPDFVLFRGDTLDGRLPTQDDGPAVLELLRRYAPRLTERGFLLLERRAEPSLDVVGENLLLDREVRFDEPIDLAALGPGAKAISFQIDNSLLGHIRDILYQPPTVFLRVTLTDGETRQYRLTPNMVRDPVLIDPLPLSADDYAELFPGRLRPNVAAVKLVLSRDAQRTYFAEPLRVTIWLVRGLPASAGAAR